MISNTRYWFLLLLISLVYLAGMFVTLFENDSAQFAVMAMRMVQENDFFSLFKGPEAYLDKPHMHYWLAAISFKIFGLYDWAYRIPGILAIFLGAYSCFGLGKLLYNTWVGKLSALIFMTAQTIVLSAIDVRTDAVLTGFTIFAIWQLSCYIENQRLKNLVMGAFGAGIAFSTKGQIALLVIGLPLLCHLAYTRKWQVLLNWKLLIAVLAFAVTITPMLYAYYLQFDMHPELIIRGKGNRSGLRFIFWEQSFERLSGEGIGKNSSDYFFFFHTFLWVFLPWTVLAILGYWRGLRSIFKFRFRRDPERDFLTIGGIGIVFIIVSFAQFKLPHYLNIVIPLFAVLTASYLYSLNAKNGLKTMNVLLGIQYFILGLCFISSVLIYFFVFKAVDISDFIGFIILTLLAVYYSFKKEDFLTRIITISALSAIMINTVLNTHFYPSLLKYQGGSAMSEVVSKEGVPADNIYKVNSQHSWALDFYNRRPVAITSIQALENLSDVWVYASDNDLKELESLGFAWDKQYTVDQFRISRLQGKFLNPETRKKVLKKMHLVHLQ